MSQATGRQRRPFGLWDSAVGVDDVTDGIGLRTPTYDTDGRSLIWLERRGADAVLLCRSRGEVAPRELASGHRIRTKVFYGGGEFTVGRGCVVFVDDGSRLFVQPLDGGRARALTPAFGHPSAPTVSPDGRWIIYVHSDGRTDRIAFVGSQGHQWPQWLAEGADFYMQPAWHPRGRMLAWVEWDFPNMAWDGTRLMLADLRLSASGPTVSASRAIAGGDETSVFQPEFSPDGRWLAYASDEDGEWSRLYLRDLQSAEIICLTPDDEGDVAMPGWVQGLRTHAFSGDGKRLYFTRSHNAERRAFVCDLATRHVMPVETLSEYAWVTHLATAPRGDELAVVASTPHQSDRILSLRTTRQSAAPAVQARSGSEALDSAALSSPEAVDWTAADGSAAHGLYYPPSNPGFDSDGLPPLLVHVHGGPTGQSDVSYDAEVQYFATRGWGVLLVNHRGSTGYGRRYMTAMRGNWGVYDVEDSIGGARHLVDESRVDASRLVISGGSAGGYTVLRTLTLHPGFFRAGVCRYGISNLFGLSDTTHKFESRYNDHLLGPLPEAAPRYRERSPINAADALQDPVILFQGTEDDVVPRDQSDAIVESLRERGIPHEYHVYEGEGHGFRRPETKRHYLQAVDAFLRRHVLFA
ncbi:MAG TPA: S9 family peptidase [Candidatus Latescibacteria bacterium]|nr:hypothetical protein [Gemmatimonadaceae bacterium]MDP6017638.1 S9 family peptidase [Candidatus Latescibacterota bacterium]HJP32553.1 S9 family peptidase [Candidatus Latescibacterota bacterium]